MQKRLPLGITSFKKIRDKNYIYVDKTDIIAKFVGDLGPFFLSRPRRFGKSTLVDTLDVLFSQGIEAFSGLKITQSDNNESLDEIKQRLDLTKTYKVLRLSFDKIDTLSPKEIEIKYIEILKKFFATLNIHIASNSTDISTIMDIGCEQLQEEIVLLIDEYDTPLTYYLDDSEKFKEIRAILSRFYKIVKRYDEIFRFIFITGITKYSNDNIFSGFNNYQDLSFDSEYGSIVGYTQEELEYYFKDYIQKAAVTLNEKEGVNIYTYELMLQKLKEHYDGYCFDEDASTHVYNPWSILNFLNESHRGFIPYWLNSGGAMPALLLKYMQRQQANDNYYVQKYLSLDKEFGVSINALNPASVSIYDERFSFIALLYQAGYLTIKRITDAGIILVYSNKEVKDAFAKVILKTFYKKQNNESLFTLKDNIQQAFKFKNYALAIDEFNKVINNFSPNSTSKFNEALFVDIVAICLTIANFRYTRENPSALGYSDLCFEAYDRVFVCEFKLATSESKIKLKLKEAKEQIQKRKYNMLLTNKEVVSLAIVALNTKLDEQSKVSDCKIALIEEI